MAEIILKARRRELLGKQVKVLRREGQLPAVLYGRGFEPTPVVLDLKESTRILSRVASSMLVIVELDGEKHLSLVRERQKDYLKGSLKHVDFQVVSMKDKLRVQVRLEFVGESFAVKTLYGIMVTNVNSVEIECLPQDLPGKIVVDISALKMIGDSITVGNLVAPANVVVLDDPVEVICVVAGQAAEEVVPGEAGEEVEPEVIEKGKLEEEEEA